MTIILVGNSKFLYIHLKNLGPLGFEIIPLFYLIKHNKKDCVLTEKKPYQI